MDNVDEEQKRRRQLERLACRICAQPLVNPKVLSCFHTFCLGCLEQRQQQTGRDAAASDETRPAVVCPVCRNETTAPHGGLKYLPSDFSVRTSLLERRHGENATNRLPVVCDICADDDGEEVDDKTIHAASAAVPMATVTCVDCRQALCDSCSKFHDFFLPTRNHRVRPLALADDDDETHRCRPDSPADIGAVEDDRCPLHAAERVEFHCDDCSEASCAACFVERHNGHRFTEIDDGDFVAATRRSLAASVALLLPRIAALRDDLGSVTEDASIDHESESASRRRRCLGDDEIAAERSGNVGPAASVSVAAGSDDALAMLASAASAAAAVAAGDGCQSDDDDNAICRRLRVMEGFMSYCDRVRRGPVAPGVVAKLFGELRNTAGQLWLYDSACADESRHSVRIDTVSLEQFRARDDDGGMNAGPMLLLPSSPRSVESRDAELCDAAARTDAVDGSGGGSEPQSNEAKRQIEIVFKMAARCEKPQSGKSSDRRPVETTTTSSAGGKRRPRKRPRNLPVVVEKQLARLDIVDREEDATTGEPSSRPEQTTRHHCSSTCTGHGARLSFSRTSE